jgi:UDP-glucose 4-epimerase
LARALADEQIEVWGSGEVVRDYVFIADTVDALISAMALPRHIFQGEEPVFNIGSGIGVSLNEILIHLGDLLGRNLRVRRTQQRGFDVGRNVLDIAKAKRCLGWVPRTSLLEGLARSIAASQATSSGSDQIENSD